MRTTTAMLGALVVTTSAFAATASAQTQTFLINRGGENAIQFVSDAPLERMTGRSDQLSGELTIDPNNLSTARGRITIPVASLRTGIDLRDEHLRGEDWLDAARNPNVTFEITGVEGATRLEPNQQTELRLRGRFTIHGVTRETTATARVRYVPGANGGGRVSGQANFSVRLTDHRITVSAPVRLKVANEIQVNVRLVAQSGSSQRS